MIIYSPTFTGSVQITGSQTVTGDLTVQGNLTAQTFILSSSVSYFTESFASGSTRFGDSMDDTMKVTGSLLLTGSATFSSTLGVGVASNSTFAINVLKDESTTNSIIGVAQIGRATTGTAANGIGGNIQLTAEDTAGNQRTAAYIGWSLTNVSSSAPEGYMYIGARNVPDTLSITDTGKVGIGITNPSYPLVVYQGSSTGYSMGIGGSIYGIRFDNTGSFSYGGSAIHGVDSTFQGSYQSLAIDASILKFGIAGAERMRITTDGYTKITSTGTYADSTGYYHECYGGAANGYTLIVTSPVATPLSQYVFDLRFSAASPNNGNARFFSCSDSTTVRAFMKSNGGLSNYQANNTDLSDIRTKKDISLLESYWNKFKALEIVKYKYKDQTHDDFNIGVIAQQVEEVAPEFVDVDGWSKNDIESESPLKSIYTKDLYHATIKVLQEAMAKIEVLEAEIDELKNK